MTPLMFASYKGYLEITKLLLEQEGIDVNTKDYKYYNILVFQNNIWNLFKLFITALIYASSNDHINIVKLLLEQEGIDINAKNKIYINNFVFQNTIWKLFKLFYTALISASRFGHIEIVKLLLEQKGIDINAKDIYLFLFRIYYNNLIYKNNIRKLYQLYDTAFILASFCGHKEIVRLLNNKEFNCNA